MQDSNTSEMIFGVAELISFCSHNFTLEPGDVILTGTPWGCGEFMEPEALAQARRRRRVRDRGHRGAAQPGGGGLMKVHAPRVGRRGRRPARRRASLIAGGTHVDAARSAPTDVARQPAPRRASAASTRDGDRVHDRRDDDARRRSAARSPFLHDAIESIASPTIRNLATVGGNLFVPQPHGDLAVCLLALDARQIVDDDGRATSACRGRGPRHRVSFTVPERWFYTQGDAPQAELASIVTVASDGARIALGGVAREPVRALAAEAALAARSTSTRAAAGRAVEAADPFDDAYASAWYRRRVLPVHVRRALLGE